MKDNVKLNNIKFILSIVDDDFERFTKSFDAPNCRVDWNTVLKTAINNRVLYCFTKSLVNKRPISDYNCNIDVITAIIEDGNVWLKRFFNTLELLDQYIGWEHFIAIKTFKHYQDITFDVDIASSDDISDRISHLREINFELRGINAGYEYKTTNRDYLTIDYYKDFLFRDRCLLTKSFIYNSPRRHTIHNKYYYLPNIEAELLLCIAQLNFQNRFITLHDFVQITKMILDNKDNLNWDRLLTEVTTNNWNKSLINTLSIIESLYLQLYGKSLNIPITSKKNISCKFPYFISPISVIKYDFELFRYTFFKKYFVQDLRYLLYEFLSYVIRKKLPIYRDWINLDYLLKNGKPKY